MALKPISEVKYRRRIFGQLLSLVLQFVLGMLLNFFGGDSTGVTHVIYIVILVLHVLNAIGLVEGAIYIALKDRGSLAWRAAGAMFVAFAGGVLTTITKQDIWSFVMALGFIGGAALYVVLYIQADRALRESKERTANEEN